MTDANPATPDPGTGTTRESPSPTPDTTPADDAPTPEDSLLFGDGEHGRPPPTGQDNETAEYRTGNGPAGNLELITLAEASDLARVSVGALRKRYRSGDLTRRYADDGKVLLDAAEVRRVYHVAQATDQKEPAGEMTAAETQKEPAPSPEVPEGSLLVPLSAWEKMLEQLGNLHTTGQEIAEARERAAHAEEREAFAQQRRQEAENRARVLEEELSRMKDAHDRYANVTNPEPTTGGTEPEPAELSEQRAPRPCTSPVIDPPGSSW